MAKIRLVRRGLRGLRGTESDHVQAAKAKLAEAWPVIENMPHTCLGAIQRIPRAAELVGQAYAHLNEIGDRATREANTDLFGQAHYLSRATSEIANYFASACNVSGAGGDRPFFSRRRYEEAQAPKKRIPSVAIDPYYKKMRGKTPRGRGALVARGAVVDVVHPRGGMKITRGVVVGAVPESDFSRAYGRQVLVCELSKRGGAHVSEVGAGDAIVRGRVKKMPKACAPAVAEYKESYAPLFRRKR